VFLQERQSRGFTLPEILATLAVAAVGASMAIPALQDAMTEQQRTRAINELIGTLHVARNTAITRNAAVTVCASPNGSSCEGDVWQQGWLVFADASGDRTPQAEEILQVTTLPGNGTAIVSTDFSPHLTFSAAGQLISSDARGVTGRFFVCDPGVEQASRVIHVLASGAPRLDDRLADASSRRCG
jgi:prepilin-type N-terminal cleavage/methylation domain-containing protein